MARRTCPNFGMSISPICSTIDDMASQALQHCPGVSIPARFPTRWHLSRRVIFQIFMKFDLT